jgi:hypothetical protein
LLARVLAKNDVSRVIAGDSRFTDAFAGWQSLAPTNLPCMARTEVSPIAMVFSRHDSPRFIDGGQAASGQLHRAQHNDATGLSRKRQRVMPKFV